MQVIAGEMLGRTYDFHLFLPLVNYMAQSWYGMTLYQDKFQFRRAPVQVVSKLHGHQRVV